MASPARTNPKPNIPSLPIRKIPVYFRVAFNLTIKGELLPVDKAQDIVDEIQRVLTKHGALDALEVKEEIKPTRDYHVARHTAFTPEQNLALEEACPIVAMIKTKGRGVK
jgi:hypothetical protein